MADTSALMYSVASECLKRPPYRCLASEIRELIPLLLHAQAAQDLRSLTDRYERLANYLEVFRAVQEGIQLADSIRILRHPARPRPGYCDPLGSFISELRAYCCSRRCDWQDKDRLQRNWHSARC